MGKKDKKKGKGAEKTAAKTEKKAMQKMKKELAAKGEEDIEKIIAEFQEEDRKRCHVGEEQCAPPTYRSGFTLCAHPDKDELLLFGGEYFNGSKTFMYNDLYIYNMKKNQWSIIQCPVKPPPRCSHQAVSLSQGGGQMWIFGGEFASPTRSQFYHYKDLWVFHIAERKWEQIKVSGAPSSRSGHRMVVIRKKLLVFGGFHESVRDYKYFSDVHVFDLEKYQWNKIETTGKVPSPRSGCQMAPLIDGRVVVYGGYCKEKVKKEVDRGITYTDMYILQFDDRSSKWKWVQIKQSGIHPSPRCGFSLALAAGDRAFLFGGVQDEDDSEETLTSMFYNDLYALELDKGRWLPIVLHGKQEKAEKKRRRKAKDLSDGSKDSESDEETFESSESQLEKLNLSKPNENEIVQIADDGVFTVKIGPQNAVSDSTGSSVSIAACADEGIQPFRPCPRMNAIMVVKHSVLYLYGGLFEDGDKQITLADFYCLDLHKLDEWKVLIPISIESQEWIESEESEDDEDESEVEDTAAQNKASDDESSEEHEMDIS